MRRFRLPPQILRLVLLTLAIVGTYLVARTLLTPESFGAYGWYRGAALTEIASRTPLYAGKPACEECHAEVAQKLAKLEHKTLSCETCHGPNREHALNHDVVPMKVPGSLCLRCHEANPSRPAWLKQIVVKNHYGEKCDDCHLPHQPSQTP
jgi:hypothetical protein